MHNRVPAEVFPPGEFLRDELEARNWTQTEFAEIIGRSTRLVNEIIAGKRGISPETAMDFAAAFGTSAQFWMNLESAYQLYKAGLAYSERSSRDERISREARLRERFPVKDLIRKNWIEESENYEVLESRVFRFYEISSIDEEPQLLHAAKRNHDESLSQVQLAWLFCVKQLAKAHSTPKYSEKRLREALDSLSALLPEAEEIRHVPRILAECGVRFVVVEPMPGSKIDGVCFWLDNGKTPVIGMTLRLDRIDNFWFVLRHEIEHVLRGDGKQSPIIDEPAENGELTSDADDNAEVAANAAAAEFCVPQADIIDFIRRVHPMYAERRVIGFARLMERHPGLVVGQIQHKTKRWELFKRHQVKTRHIITETALTDGYGRSAPIVI